jgi:hypothetical protein
MFGLLYSAKNIKCFKNAKDKRCLKLKRTNYLEQLINNSKSMPIVLGV